jgi:inositol-pentakisphosphate 2-kinase
MHSVYKNSSGQSAAVGYCPLDLFSGERARVKKAIESLWSSWLESNGKINNLKVFVEGGTITPGEVRAF